jgi:hypothetical protein
LPARAYIHPKRSGKLRTTPCWRRCFGGDLFGGERFEPSKSLNKRLTQKTKKVAKEANIEI